MTTKPHISLNQENLFAVISLPGENHYTLLLPSEQSKKPNNIDFKVVLHPFLEKSDCPAVQFKVEEALKNQIFSFRTNRKSEVIDQNIDDYKLSTNRAINDMKNDMFKKIVMSRTISVSNDNHVEDVFASLVKNNESAFVFLFNIPKHGTWMGCSPEVLLEQVEDGYETHSLAGTMSLESYQNGASWGEKEIEEQEIVNRFFRKALELNTIDYKEEKAKAEIAGNVVHLKSIFKFNEVSSGLLRHLHPSPALSAYPKSAIDLLHDYEETTRKYYCGYIGWDDPNGKTCYCINLRSMQVFKEKYCLYVGGGITKDSSAQKEWEEGQLKAQVLLQALQNTRI